MRISIENRKGKVISIMVVVVAVAVIAGVITTVVSADDPSKSPPPNELGPNPPNPSELARLQGKALVPPKVLIEPAPSAISSLEEPRVRRTEIEIGGTQVKLPDDLKFVGILAEGTPGPATPPEALENMPLLVIQRGNSIIHIGLRTGKVVGGRIDPGEEGVFDFLSRQLPEQDQAIKSLPVETLDLSRISELTEGALP